MCVCHLIKCCTVLLFIILNLTTANNQNAESIVFPTTFLKSQKPFELLTNNADFTKSVFQLTQAAEAFSLEYFQVKKYFSLFQKIQIVYEFS